MIITSSFTVSEYGKRIHHCLTMDSDRTRDLEPPTFTLDTRLLPWMERPWPAGPAIYAFRDPLEPFHWILDACALKFPENTDQSLQKKIQVWWSWQNGGQGTPRMHQERVPDIPNELEAQQTSLNLKWFIRENGQDANRRKVKGFGPCTFYK